jgi:adenylate cyclase ExoY
LGRTQNKLVHHGADQHNTHTELDANFPATFFLPKPLGDTGVSLGPENGAVVLIENLGQLKGLIELGKNQGYHFDFSKKWSPEVLSVKRTSFKEALERFESKGVGG